MSRTASVLTTLSDDLGNLAGFDEATPRVALDAEGVIVRANDELCALLSKSYKDIEGQAFLNCIESIQDEDGKALGDLTKSGIYSVVLKDAKDKNTGQPLDFYFEWLGTSHNQRFLVGSFIGHSKLLEDLHDTSSVPEMLSAYDLNVFASLSHSFLVVLSPTGKIVRANSVFEQKYPDRTSQMFADVFVEKMQNDIKKVIKRANKQNASLETVSLFEQNEKLSIRWTLKRDGKYVYALGTDVSALKAQEKQIGTHEKQLLEAESIGRMGHWRWVIGQDDISWSGEIYRLFGVDESFSPSLDTMTSMVSRRDMPRVNRAFQRAMIEHNNYDMEFQINRPDGSIRYVHCEGRCELDSEGELRALYGVMQDVTERVLYEKELRAAKTSAERSYAAKTQFLANMSHELRTPLNAILGFSQMMQQELLGPLGSPKYLEYVDGIYDSGQHLLNIISDILDMSKIEAGKYELALEKINVHEVVKSATRMVQARAEESGIKLEVNHETADDLIVVADRRAIKQILLNILSNALKFTKSGGTVTVETFAREGYLALKIKDTGIGIPANKLPYITRPFEQVSHSYARDHDGSGLGLAITKDLIELHGGGLTIDSEVGVGTTVNIRLPYDADQVQLINKFS